jgi:predicted PurR-regulated permease PerM
MVTPECGGCIVAEGSRPDAQNTGEVPTAAATRQLPYRLAELQGERLYRFAGLLFLFAVIFVFFDPITRVLLIAFVGAIIAVALNAIVVRLPIRRGIAVLLLVLTLFGSVGLIGFLGIRALIVQVRQLIEDFPTIVAGVEAWVQDTTGLELDLLGPRTRAAVGDMFGVSDGVGVVAGAFGFLEVVGILLLVVVGAFFLVHKPNDQLLTPLMRAVPKDRRPAFRRMFQLMGKRLGGWLAGTLISMAAVGALGVIAFYVLGTPYPVLLGLVLGITELIPIVGPWVGGFVAVAVTLFDDPGRALWVAVAVLVIQQIESNVVRPMAMSSSAELHPFVTLLALLLFGSMFGLLGAILALPLTLAIASIVQVFWVEETLHAGDDEIEPVVGKRE